MKKSKKIAALICTAGMCLASIGIAYAGPANEITGGVETQVQAIVSYSKEQAVSLGQWEAQADGVTWKFKQFTGTYLTSSWIESQTEAGVWYFVDANGIMLTSTTTPDGYPVDSLGKWYSTTPQSTQPQQSTQQSTAQKSTLTMDDLNNMSYEELRQWYNNSMGYEVIPKGGNADLSGGSIIKGSQ